MGCVHILSFNWSWASVVWIQGAVNAFLCHCSCITSREKRQSSQVHLRWVTTDIITHLESVSSLHSKRCQTHLSNPAQLWWVFAVLKPVIKSVNLPFVPRGSRERGSRGSRRPSLSHAEPRGERWVFNGGLPAQNQPEGIFKRLAQNKKAQEWINSPFLSP